MTIQALVNLRLRSEDQVIDLLAGQTMSLSPEKVEVLLAKIPNKIRVIHPGWTVTWNSPLFGVCEGTITEVKADALILSEHGVTKEPATIPAAWITNMSNKNVDWH